MLLILPPSESKRAGGEGAAIDLGRLSFPELTPQRASVLAALEELAVDLDAMAAALKVGEGLRQEIERNRELVTSATLPALERFTGVLYDALDAATLGEGERAFAGRHIAIHSALFGLIGASDAIPAYRLSHDSRIPGVSLKRTWARAIADTLERREGIILDLRSEAYAALGPAPRRPDSFFVRVVAEDGGGRRRALNHFNKKGKGEFVRAVIQSGQVFADADALMRWSASAGFPLDHGREGELELVVANSLAA
ncbi:peroxide stress protein YaaA [Salinibacterium sp. SYSU T00001]|uniref:YaaA family protein n=1 Tax=Homoserinimonas sedimenticola TaxID=2986805 RepID=UPI0022364D18|nr:peroxide stress protein YaaA [Salinibacterium sedimenticola]MCW4386670.1 peroxide stress protein YaaA [Salinibacterium sedimenticola]